MVTRLFHSKLIGGHPKFCLLNYILPYMYYIYWFFIAPVLFVIYRSPINYKTGFVRSLPYELNLFCYTLIPIHKCERILMRLQKTFQPIMNGIVWKIDKTCNIDEDA